MLMCHPLIAGWNELVIHTRKDATSKVTPCITLQPNVMCVCACVRVLKLMLAGSFTACVLGLALSYHHCNRVIFNPKRQWCCSM